MRNFDEKFVFEKEKRKFCEKFVNEEAFYWNA